MPNYQRRQYEEIAAIFRNYGNLEKISAQEVLNSLRDDFVWLFQRDNGRFDEGIFRMKSMSNEEHAREQLLR